MRHSMLHAPCSVLLLLLNVQSVLAEPRAELAQLELLTACLATDRVVMVAGFLADEEHGFDLSLSFTSSHGRREGSGFGVQ